MRFGGNIMAAWITGNIISSSGSVMFLYHAEVTEGWSRWMVGGRYMHKKQICCCKLVV